MLMPADEARIFIYFKPVDMRKAIDGLSSLVMSCLDESPQSGDIYLFRNKRGNKIKLIFWDRNGFVMYYKRLDKGGFKFPKNIDTDSITITRERLDWLLMGFDFMSGHTAMTPNSIHYF